MSKANIDSYININNNDQTKQTSLNILLLEINANKLSIHQLVEYLGDYLQNTDSILRARGTLLLSEVLCRLPDLKLNEAQVEFLAAFYHDRLQDYACASEVVKGVYGLCVNHKVPYPHNQKMIRAIFQEVHPSTLVQTHRKMVLQLIEHLLEHNLTEIQELKGDFMAGFLQFIDGEKDPRNIIYTFRLIPRVILYIPEYKNFADSLFEILSCYFPISFNPKPGDPNSITKDDLVSSLLNCFGASTYFAEHCIPFLIDKICSNVVDTKIESLKTLLFCCSKYGPVALRPHLDDIWGTLRTQILTQKSATVIDESKKTMFYLTRVLAADQETLQSFLSMVDKECLHHIKTSQDSKLAVSCASILFQTVSASVKSSRIVLSHILPTIIDFFKELSLHLSDDPIHKANEQLSIIGLFNDLLKANNISFQYNNENIDKEINPLEEYKDKLYDLFIGLLSNSSALVRTLAVDCLANLYVTRHIKTSVPITFVLDQEKRQSIIKDLGVWLLIQIFRNKSLEALMSITKLEQVEQMNLFAIPTLLQMINANQSKNVSESKHYLEAFSQLCTHQPLLQSVIPQIKTLLEHSIKKKYINNDEFENSLLVLQSLENTFSNSIDEQTMTICYREILLPLVKELFEQVFSLDVNSQEQKDQVLGIMKPAISMIHSNNKKEAIELFINIYLNGDLSALQINKEFKPFSSDATEQAKLLIPIFTSVISQSKFELSTNKLLKEMLMSRALDSNVEESISNACAICYGSIINKQTDQTDLPLDHLEQLISSSSTNKTQALNLLIWIEKGLVTNGNPQSIKVGELLAQLITSENTEISQKAAKSFYILLSDHDTFDHKSGAIVKRQKNETVSSQFLVAITNLLRNVPKEVLLGELQEVLPIVLHSLHSNQRDLLNSSLQTLMMLVDEASTSISSHLDSLIPTLIKISVNGESLTFRQSSLEILTRISRAIPYPKIYPFRNQVINGIVPALDDKKRLVRREATKCRNSWFILQ
ncbi:putative DNA repair and transcription protein [Heterostelium album PN500]|uniref:MMS19 nucleotide excision repair protein n=1 Tax=Heterostelium pallidum (strain ATCC 26659 / Pp 5 / PN500) TaxID=670386 RepID=D3AWA1_HETP5|nr:putative DNA repair and transcription protein [Heterostelium album PN500]EFA86574.1 putative DNA repair and transcription protein [Heterostelium album PN500]|eukprot:XP_020438679.1 putative DNA repair and transcription protein [Heterostelium album PN500]